MSLVTPPRSNPLRRVAAALAVASLFGAAGIACDEPAGPPSSAVPATRPATPPATASTASTAAPAAGEGVASSTRVYDVRELVVPIDDFIPDGAELDAQGRAVAATPGPSQDETLGNLVNLIRESVDPTSWTAAGGDAGAIESKGGHLIVTQTPENQAEVARLLGTLARARRVQVSVEGRFLRIDPRALAAGDAPAEVSALLADAGPAGAFLDGRQASLLADAAEGAEGRTVLSAPRLTLFDGQRAYALLDTQMSYVAGFDRVAGEGGAVRLEPRLDTASSGVTLDVRATMTPDHSAVRLVLNPVVKELVGMPEAPFPGGPAGTDLVVQRPDVRVSRLSTTALVPADQSLLLAMPTPVAAGRAGGAGAGGSTPLYLLVTPRVIEGDAPEQTVDE